LLETLALRACKARADARVLAGRAGAIQSTAIPHPEMSTSSLRRNPSVTFDRLPLTRIRTRATAMQISGPHPKPESRPKRQLNPFANGLLLRGYLDALASVLPPYICPVFSAHKKIAGHANLTFRHMT
jgi:hypothetical protein